MRLRRYTLIWGCLMALMLVANLPGNSQAKEGVKPQAAGLGALSGRVTLVPISPVQRPGVQPAPSPAPGVKLLVYGPERQEAAAVVTGTDGRFRVDLPPGQYQVEIGPRKGKEFSKDLPATVTITPGGETRLDIRLDTGMR